MCLCVMCDAIIPLIVVLTGKRNGTVNSRSRTNLECTQFTIPAGCTEIHLERRFSTEKEDCLDEFQLELLRNLRHVESAASSMAAARALFAESDQDESGALDRAELKELLRKVSGGDCRGADCTIVDDVNVISYIYVCVC